jgi:hypothetical protein
VFTSPRGGPLRHSQFRQRQWEPALTAAGLADFHFHDLRGEGTGSRASRKRTDATGTKPETSFAKIIDQAPENHV